MCLGDFNGHVGRHIDVFDWVHGGHGVGQRNLEGRMLLKFCLDKELCVSNTLFMEEKRRKVTYRIIMVIFKCYFSREHIALSYKKLCEHRMTKNQQIKNTAHDGKSYMK